MWYILFASYIGMNETKLAIIIDSQNTQNIKSITSKDKLNPCILWPMSELTAWTHLNITFDATRIHSMDDWYPKDLCEDDLLDPDWKKILFNAWVGDAKETESSLIINNLIVDSYTFDEHSALHYIIASSSKVICNNCTFSNITIHSG
eukprot:130313_1